MPMEIYKFISLIFAVAAFIGFINHRFLKISPSVAIMMGMLIISFILIIGEASGFFRIPKAIAQAPSLINFHELLINGLISFLLFAGSLTVDTHFLFKQRLEIFILSVFSTIVSTFLIAFAIYYVLILFGINLSLIYCLLFGALISPTDPIAVLAICKELRAPKQLEVILAGESLFNDGVGIVLFATFYGILTQGLPFTWQNTTLIFIRSVLGGIGYGIILGFIARYLIKCVLDHRVAILITVAITTAGYTFAQSLSISGPLAIVVAGLFVGSLRHTTKRYDHIMPGIENFWDVIDEVLNALLFALLGLELLMTHFSLPILIISLITILIVLLSRFITVIIPFSLLKIWRKYSSHIILILTWGGMRGALAVALTLSLPLGKERDLILCMTYAVVVFAIICQGLSIKSLVKKSKDA